MARRASFETVLGKLENRFRPEFCVFLRDMAAHRSEKFALECLIDQLGKQNGGLSLELGLEMSQLCRELKIDGRRREVLEELAGREDVGAAAMTQQSETCSLDDLIAADDPVAFGRANGAGEVMILRALRDKFGIPLVEAVAKLNAGGGAG